MEESVDTPKLFVFLSVWIAKSVFLIAFSAISFQTLVLGNDKVSGSMTAVFAGLILTILSFSVDIVGMKLGVKTGDKNIRRGFLFVETAVVLWFFKLFAILTGLGIASFIVVFIVAGMIIFIDEPLLKMLKRINFEA